MNKAKINELARKADGKQAGGDGSDRLQAMIYAALVGGSDFLRTQAGEAEVCRIAYARSKTAVRIWREQKAKEQQS